MKWSREKDYHGYKSYGSEAEADGFVEGIRRRLRAALNFIARPTPTPTIISQGRARGYSTLGMKSGLHDGNSPFPTEPANVTPARRP